MRPAMCGLRASPASSLLWVAGADWALGKIVTGLGFGPALAVVRGKAVWLGIIAILLGTGSIIYGMVTQTHQHNLLESNTIAKYPQIQEVVPDQWRGNLLEAEVTTTDGEQLDLRIIFDPETGEPTIQGEHPELEEQQ